MSNATVSSAVCTSEETDEQYNMVEQTRSEQWTVQASKCNKLKMSSYSHKTIKQWASANRVPEITNADTKFQQCSEMQWYAAEKNLKAMVMIEANTE